MPATTKRQVYNFGNNFERAAQAILSAGGLGDTFIQGYNRKLPASRVEVVFQTGEAMNQGRRPNGDLVYDYFSGLLAIRIVTVRPKTQPSLIEGVSTLHEEFAATVREIFEERKTAIGNYETAFNTGNLPYYTVLKMKPQQERRDLDFRWLEDYTNLPFLIEFGIRSDAWPLLSA